MTTVTRNGEVNDHYLSGYNRSIPLNMEFGAPLSPEREALVGEVVKRVFDFPVSIKVEGGLWDYDRSSDAIHTNSPVGHFRVNVNGAQRILAVHRYRGEEALELGHWAFNFYAAQNISVVNSLLIKGKIEHEIQVAGKTYFAHFEEYLPDVRWLARDLVEDRGYQLGGLISLVAQAGNSMPEIFKDSLRDYTDATSRKFQLRGIKVMNGSKIEGVDMGSVLGKYQSALEPIQGHLQATMDVLANNPRTPNAHNAIEKMVWSGPHGLLYLACCSDPAMGFQPMLTDNATYDVGTAVSRIILNEDLYSGTLEQKRAKIVANLRDFVSGFNDWNHGSHLTPQEALEAARYAYILVTAYGMGYNIENELKKGTPAYDAAIARGVDQHLAETLPAITARMKLIDDYKGMLKPPRQGPHLVFEM